MMVRGLFVLVAALGGQLGVVGPAAGLPAIASSAPAGCSSQPSGESSHATVPAELSSLVHKMRRLRANTITFSFGYVIGMGGSTFDFTTTAKVRNSPYESEVTAKAIYRKSSGSTSTHVEIQREIGDTRFTYEPKETRGDGGRPWVREHFTRSRTKEQEEGSLFPYLLGPFNEAQTINEAGQATIDGHTVEQFNLIYAPGKFPSEKLPTGNIQEGQFCEPPVEVDISIDPSGLPVLTRVSANYQNSKQSFTTTTTLEIPAVNMPIAPVKRPPAKKTISAAALHRLEAKRRSEELRKIRKQRERKHGQGHH